MELKDEKNINFKVLKPGMMIEIEFWPYVFVNSNSKGCQLNGNQPVYIVRQSTGNGAVSNRLAYASAYAKIDNVAKPSSAGMGTDFGPIVAGDDGSSSSYSIMIASAPHAGAGDSDDVIYANM